MRTYPALPLAVVLALGTGATTVCAADVVVQPAAGSGFVVKDATGANERLRVQESGAVSLPSVASAPAQPQALCMNASGQLGPCSGGSGGSYTAATGLTLTGTTFSVAPTYQLPQGCGGSQIPQWDSAATKWVCGSAAGATLPAGTVNQTLRYDAGNKLVASSSFRAFEDGGLLADGDGIGAIPAAGAGGRLMWYSADDAFRAGKVSGSQWDQSNIGRASVAIGTDTIASGFSSVAMGSDTSATKDYSVAIGYYASAQNNFSVVLGSGKAIGWAATAIGNSNPQAKGDYSVAIGNNTVAGGDFSTALGSQTTADGNYSTAMGFITTASGEQSMAMGSNVSTNGKKGSFIFGDASNRTLGITANSNEFRVIASGGVTFYTSADYMAGSYLTPGGGSWTNISDRNAKTAVQSVDSREVLKKVAALPLNTWQYKTQDAKYRHMGPMAQDFYSAFHLGESDKGIDTVDADGVALAAIQGLNALLTEKDAQTAARLDEKDREIAALRADAAAQATRKDEQLAALRAELTTRLAALESLSGDLAEVKAELAALRTQASPAAVTVALQRPR